MYVREGFYDSLIVHRVIKDFVIQSGGYDQEGWGYCVFGRVTGGMDVVDSIGNVPTPPDRG
jgi:cyclophilin family peptidyl-prolyl cis-trans isomerase